MSLVTPQVQSGQRTLCLPESPVVPGHPEILETQMVPVVQRFRLVRVDPVVQHCLHYRASLDFLPVRQAQPNPETQWLRFLQEFLVVQEHPVFQGYPHFQGIPSYQVFPVNRELLTGQTVR